MTWHPDIPEHYRNQIVTGDARVLAEQIPSESIDLVFTDPIYDCIDDYRWLAEMASQVLKPDRACLVWATNKGQLQQANAISKSGLEFFGVLNLIMWGRGGTPTGKESNFILKHTPCLYFSKGQAWPLEKVWSVNATTTLTNLNGNHKWNKDPNTCIRWISAFTQSNDIVLDPYTGGGTVPAVCKMLGRNYIAFEIDPIVAEKARERVRNTQPPLPGINQMLQAEMELE